MKKIYSIGIFLFCSGMLLAQMPANRTVNTIIADALGQLPAKDAADYAKIIKEICSTGEEGVLQLADMISPPGKGINAPVEYALSGLSHYVSAEGQESARLTTSNAYLKALDRTNDREIKAFFIRQLEIMGKDEVVGKLSGYLTDPALSGPASQTLAAIGGIVVVEALLAALPNATDNQSKTDIVLALGDIQDTKAEVSLRELLKSDDENLRKAVLYALSRTGTKLSLPDLALAAERAGYTMEKTGANEAYITLIKRALNQGSVKDAEKAANQLMAKAAKAGKVQSRGAALQVLMAVNPAKATQLLQKALKDTDRAYRNMALAYASEYADHAMYKALLKDLAKADTDTKTDIIGWFGQLYNKQGNKDEAISVVLPVLIRLINDPDINVKSATALALVKSQDSRAIPVLASLLSDTDPEVVSISKNALASFNGNISSEVAKILPIATDNGKIAALKLLAMRKSADNLNSVLLQIQEGTPQVKTAALDALKDVVSEKDLNTLYTMLEREDISAIKPIQQAIIAAISSRPKDRQINILTTQINQTDKSKQPLYYAVLASTGDSKTAATLSSKSFTFLPVKFLLARAIVITASAADCCTSF
ncbi:hypothetical protein EZS27_002618 [termite gut metagenome]|uniref:Uncharacterized protein n=1 Tax=termite gut metagenome TaxID=433724 RepID=A0A5J4SXR4_9ZZZZ